MSATQQRSTFVTVVAWIFIILSGFATMISLLQNIMVLTIFRDPMFSNSAPPPGAPPSAVFMAEHAPLIFFAFLLLSLFMLVSSIGLLRRRNWARLCFIAALGFAILWQIAGLALQFSQFSSMREEFSVATLSGGPDMTPFFVAIAAFSVIIAIGLSVLFGWIMRKLVSPPVVAEFRR
ncbi:hypothetical protein [Luteimonas sp. e5]